MKGRLSHSIFLAGSCAFAFAAAYGCGSGDSGSGTTPTTAVQPTAPTSFLADDVMIDEVAVYQAVKIALVTQGDLVPALALNAPVIAKRPAFVRVFVKGYGHSRPKVDGELRVRRGGKPDLVLHDGGKRVTPELDDSVLESTLNFEIAAEEMTADASFSVKVTAPTAADALSFPTDGGQAPFGARTKSETLKVRFVPISYEADAAAAPIVPDLSDINALRDTLYTMYPVAKVDVSARGPLRWSSTIESDGPGWDELLGGIMQLRRIDGAPRDVYYVGVLTPKPTIDQFCDKGGCILGIAPMASERDVGMRAALVLGYQSRNAGGTLAQELAHAMGRMHAPCGNPQGIDGDFPYSSGSIGVWGYNVLEKKLVDPGNRYRDYMSYCGPVWTSDYTFRGVYDRMEIVTHQQEAVDNADTGTPTTPRASASMLMQSFRIAADGSVHEGPELEVLPGDGSGDHVEVTYEGANGTIFATAKGRVRKISSTGGSIVIAPQVPVGTARARLRGAGVGGVTELRSRAPGAR